MIPYFKLVHTPDIQFGAGIINVLPGILGNYGNKVLMLHGKNFLNRSSGLSIKNNLVANNIELCTKTIQNEPSPQLVDDIVHSYKTENISVVCAIGGGSVLDAGKAVSAMLAMRGSVEEFLEGVGDKEPTGEKIPFIAIPTTSGTGSEMTKNAVISELGDGGFKKSLRHNNFVPDWAIVDPELTFSCPPDVTAASGLDAFSQLLESFLSTQANPFTDALALQGMKLIYQSIEKAYDEPENSVARSNMSYAAMLSGITLANAGLGLVHGYAQPLGSMFEIPHGVVCGTLMAEVNRYTLNKLLEEDTNSSTFIKYAQLGRHLLESNIADDKMAANKAIESLERLTKKLNLPLLSKYNIKATHIPKIAEQTGLKYHPLKLSRDDIEQILLNRLI